MLGKTSASWITDEHLEPHSGVAWIDVGQLLGQDANNAIPSLGVRWLTAPIRVVAEMEVIRVHFLQTEAIASLSSSWSIAQSRLVATMAVICVHIRQDEGHGELYMLPRPPFHGLNSSFSIAPSKQWLQWWSHGHCVHILRDEGHLLSEQQFVDCSKQSSGCNDGLMHAAFTSYKMKAIASLRGSLSRWSGWSHKRCVHILQDEDHRLSEHRFVDCSKQSRGCHGGLMDAAFTFYKMKAIASLRSSPLIAPSGAVAATVISWTPRSHSTS